MVEVRKLYPSAIRSIIDLCLDHGITYAYNPGIGGLTVTLL